MRTASLIVIALRHSTSQLSGCGDPLVDTNRIGIITLALGARLPTMSDFSGIRRSGRLLSYRTELSGPVPARRSIRFGAGEAGRHPGRATDQSRSSDHPMTAKALGLTVSTALLVRADEVGGAIVRRRVEPGQRARSPRRSSAGSPPLRALFERRYDRDSERVGVGSS